MLFGPGLCQGDVRREQECVGPQSLHLTCPWRVGRVTLTIGEGGDFDTDPTTDDEGLVWGGAVAGLSVGMRLTEAQRE